MTISQKNIQFDKLQQQLLHLNNSPLYEYRVINNYQPVIGEGSLDAKIIFIGEAPGKNEAIHGRPFIGAAGKVLDQLLESIKLDRQDVYITSILHDRPPNNRDPKPYEVQIYKPIIDGLIEIIQPRVIATLGRHSMKYILEKFDLSDQLQTISKIHGQAFTAQTEWIDLRIIPLYHPAVALYKTTMKQYLLDDFQKLAKFA